MEIMPDMTFLGHQIRMWKSPLVYVLRDGENRALYVGMSTCGIGRPFTPDHHAIRNTDNSHRIEVYYRKNKRDALALEGLLIRELQPPRNRTVPRTNRPSAEIGIQDTPRGWRAFVRVAHGPGGLRTKSFPPDTTMETMQAWREEQKVTRR